MKVINMKKREGYFASRRSIVKWGLCGLGTLALTTLPQTLTAQPRRRIKTLTFNPDDIGLLNFTLLLEELEAAFYTEVIKSRKISNPQELEFLKALGTREAAHVKLLRNVLGTNTIFKTSELRLNRSGIAALVSDRNKILNTAGTLEDVCLHVYNSAGTSLINPTYLLATGSIVAIEARHAAGVRALIGRAATELDKEWAVLNPNLVASLNPLKGRAYDQLYTPKQIVAIVSSLNILNNPINGALVA